MIFLSLGSNIGDRLNNLKRAISLIQKSKQVNILSKSKIYETSPMENYNQAKFLNQVVKIKTKLPPFELLNFIKSIEFNMGRVKDKKRYMPRIIDIDILTYDSLCLKDDILSIPHPKIKLRKFILKPWTDIDSNYILVNSKSTIKELLDKVNNVEDQVKEYN